MANVILYGRFSPRPNSNECDSIEKQMRDMDEYCTKYGHTVVGRFSDAAMSGSDADRPGLWDAIFNLKRGYLLLIRSWDRLARDTYLSEVIQMSVKRKGCTILSISQEDTSKDNPESKLIRTILLALAEYQRQVTRARTRAAMKRYQREGRRMTVKEKLPYGYQLDPENDMRMIPHPIESLIVQRVIILNRDGKSKRTIAKQLTEEGYIPRPVRIKEKGVWVNREGTWRHQIILSILRRAKEYHPEILIM